MSGSDRLDSRPTERVTLLVVDEAGRVEVKTALPADLSILAARFDNLKEGAPALVKARSSEDAKASDGAATARRRIAS